MLISDRLIETKGRPSGFDYLRLILALSVFSLHIVVITYGDTASNHYWLSWRKPLAAIVLPLFFALSGFLVTGSLFRVNSLFQFLGLRAMRIVPALAVEVVLCAFILGPLFTTSSLADYFSDRRFYVYFFNIIGRVHFILPGVFDANPHPHVVNEQLWTIPWELFCYVLLAALSVTRIVLRRTLLLALTLGLQLAAFLYDRAHPQDVWVSVHGIVLVECFLAGVVLFTFRDSIPLNRGLFLASVFATIGLLSRASGEYLIAFPAAYVTIYLGMLNSKKYRIALSGDYSYGIYLYGFPLQQAVAAVMPGIRYADLLFALPLTIIVAVFSWWCVERPTLQLRKSLPVIEQNLLRRFQRAGQTPAEQ